MSRRTVEAAGSGVRIVGWVENERAGARVLVLHGGPGLNHDYVEGLAAEVADGHCVASYQQRGLAPSSEEGPFEVSDHVSDIALVLDALGWQRAVLLGHSWGGHLALQAAVSLPDRVAGVLAVDTWGAVGDGGGAEFEAALVARTPPDDLRRIAELEAVEARGEAAPGDSLEGFRLIWPAYFATRDAAPPMPELRVGGPCYAETMASAGQQIAALETALPTIEVPVGLVVGAGSPMPATASTDVAQRIDGAWVETVPDAGHFIWIDAPGRVRSALERLIGAVETGSEQPGSAG